MNLEGKTAIVTGGSDGIGQEVSFKLAKEGANLALLGRDDLKLNQVVSAIQKDSGVKVKGYAVDLTQNQALKQTVKEILTDFPDIQILLNIAGIWQKAGPLEEIGADLIDRVIQTNLISLIQLTRLVLPVLKEQEEAAIINVSSRSGVVASAGQSVYAASKWGVTGFTEVLKADLKGSPVRVAGVYQAGTNTQMFNKAGDYKDEAKLSQFTRPEDLADVIVFMLSRPPRIWLHDVRVEY